jgi:hypothetical protein
MRLYRGFFRTGLLMLGLMMVMIFPVRAQPLLSSALPTPNQVAGLIQAGQYQTAYGMLQQILQVHPESAKAQYLLAVDDWKLGNLDAARMSLSTAQGLDPTMKFASAYELNALQSALSVQHTSHGHPILWTILILCLIGAAVCFVLSSMRPKQIPTLDRQPAPPPPNQGSGRFAGTPTGFTAAPQPSQGPRPYPGYAPPGYPASPTTAQPQTTIINNNTGGGNGGMDFVAGMMIGDMLSQPERTVVEEVPVYVPEQPVFEQPVQQDFSQPDPLSQQGQSSDWDNQSQQQQPDNSGWGNDNSGGSGGGGGGSSDDDSW